MALILEEMSEGSKLHISPTFQKITLREGGRERGGGGGGLGAEKKWNVPLSKLTVLFKRNTVEMADIYCS